jgi:hypothetical protein
MSINNMSTWIKILTTITFLIMIAVNALANILPINGVTTGEVSAAYENLFSPAGITFAIWGLIYFMLACYTLYQLGLFQGNDRHIKTDLLEKIGVIFSISSIANSMWVFLWHYDFIALSVVVMIIILICLIMIVTEISKYKLTFREQLFIKLPFSVYFGWITIATIANITTFLVSIGWNGFEISDVTWTIIILIVGVILSALTIIKFKDIAYGLVIIWAYMGIYIKHTSVNGFDGQYPSIITTVVILIAVIIIVELYAIYLKGKNLQ